MSHSFIDSHIAPIFVALISEKGSERTMTDDVVGDDVSELFGKSDKPLLSCSFFQSNIILPIYLSSIEMIINDEMSKFVGTLSRVQA